MSFMSRFKQAIKTVARWVPQLLFHAGLYRLMPILVPRIEYYLGIKISFSQFGEDLILHSLLEKYPEIEGVYVDVGSNRPVWFSNTYKAYLKGYRGLCIDGNPELIARYHRVRRGDVAACEVISSNSKSTQFYLSKNSYQPSLDRAALNDEPQDGILEVTPKSLTQVLDERGFSNQKIAFLSIDCEGHDLSVLRSLDLTRYLPTIICIEDHGFDPLHKELSAIYQHLIGSGYSYCAYSPPSTFYIKI